MDKEGNSFSKEVRSDRTRLWATWESVVAVNIKKRGQPLKHTCCEVDR